MDRQTDIVRVKVLMIHVCSPISFLVCTHTHKPSAKVEAMQLDLSSLRGVKAFADEFISKGLPLHILVLNAGVFGGPFTLTMDGMERHFAVNHLGHFYLATLLADVMKSSKPARVVVVSSESHWYEEVYCSYTRVHDVIVL